MEQLILVPLDGSALAENVLPQAQALARLTARGLLLLHVVTPAETSQTRLWRAAAPAELRHEWEESALTRTHAYLAALAARLRAEGLSVHTETLSDHDPARAIVERAARDPAITLIAMATHGRGGLGRWALGSVAAQTLAAAPTPLLLVRMREDGAGAPPAGGYRQILVPLDGSAQAEQALGPAQALADACDATLTLLIAAPPIDDPGLADAGVVPYWMEQEQQDQRQRAGEYLAHLAARLAAAGVQVRPEIVTGAPAEAILRAADDQRADLIVMAAHTQPALAHRRLGRVAAKIAQSAQAPLLLVRS